MRILSVIVFSLIFSSSAWANSTADNYFELISQYYDQGHAAVLQDFSWSKVQPGQLAAAFQPEKIMRTQIYAKKMGDDLVGVQPVAMIYAANASVAQIRADFYKSFDDGDFVWPLGSSVERDALTMKHFDPALTCTLTYDFRTFTHELGSRYLIVKIVAESTCNTLKPSHGTIMLGYFEIPGGV